MISCDDYQKKIVAVFDNESSDDDKELIDIHLKDCPECRSFLEDMVRIRQQFVSVPMPSLSPTVTQELMQAAQTGSWQRESRKDNNGQQRLPLLVKFPRLAWTGGLAALFLIAASWMVSFSLARKVEALTQELETSRREIARAREKEQLEEAQERQQKAISALYFLMAELEDRVEIVSPPRMISLPTEHYEIPNGQGDL